MTWAWESTSRVLKGDTVCHTIPRLLQNRSKTLAENLKVYNYWEKEKYQEAVQDPRGLDFLNLRRQQWELAHRISSDREVSRQQMNESTEWRHSDRTGQLCQKIHRSLKNTQRTSNPINTRTNELNRHFSREVQMADKYVKNCSSSSPGKCRANHRWDPSYPVRMAHPETNNNKTVNVARMERSPYKQQGHKLRKLLWF